MFRTGLFDAWIRVDEKYLESLWRACTMPYEYFRASLVVPDSINLSGEAEEVDLRFTYEIGRGKTAWQDFPSQDWIV